MSFKDILLSHIKEYPLMQPADAVKLAYQSEFGPAHLISDLKRAEEMIAREAASVENRDVSLLCEDIGSDYMGGGYVRFNLALKDPEGVSNRLLSRIFAASGGVPEGTPDFSGTMENFLRKISVIRELTESGSFGFTSAELEEYLRDYEKAGYPAVSHSPQYREAYAPAYRVIKKCYAEILPVLTEIDRLVSENSDQPVLVAIDGNAAAGKTTLAERIAEVFDCNVFHMDDFFLPLSLRSEERLAEPGGNVHYERFRDEVLTPLASKKPFSYGVFDCSVMAISGQRAVEPKKLNIIEGSYSHHPYFGSSYDLRIFMKISPEEQMERILRRNGEFMAEKFRKLWIPMENRYFEHFGLETKSDIVLLSSIPSGTNRISVKAV